jgi:membrane protease YdiL (CAAX protease family)
MSDGPTASHRQLEVAPRWHTAVALLIIFSVSGVGAYRHSLSPVGFAHGKSLGYLSVIVMQWLTLAFICYGVRQRGLAFPGLIDGSWPRWTSVLRDIVLAVGFIIVSAIILASVSHLLHAGNRDVLARLLPHTRIEIALYLLLCATAGFCEEIIFRGYLQKQFCAWTHSVSAGLILQAVVFGAAHGYQGPRLMVVITVFGLLFGLLAQGRQSLRPGMIGHFLQDALPLVLLRLQK